jgi:gamma-glutamyltranspeptidase/glutathione hydrolase
MDVIDVRFGSAVQRFRVGVGSCGVPGAPAGLGEAHRRWASWPWADLVTPAVGLARDGVALTPEHHAVHVLLESILHASPAGRAIFAAEGATGAPGVPIRQLDLAATLERLAEAGAADLYVGELAERIAAFFTAEGGAVTREDLAAYRVVPRRPVETRYHGHAVVTNAPPSTGGLLLAYALAVAEGLGHPGPPLGPDAIRVAAAVLTEAESRRAPDLGRRLIRGGARRLLDDTAVEEGRARVLGALAAGPLVGHAAVAARGTTHISVLDGAGNAACMTVSTGTGSGVFVGDTGIHMNNILGEEDLVAEGTRVRAGHRLTSMMAPTHLAGPDGFEAVVGSSGSARIRSALYRVITGLVDHDLSAREAVDLARLHPTATALDLEGGTPHASVEALRQAGEVVLAWPDRNVYFGGAQVAARRHGRLEAAGDPRRGGAGMVVGP